MRHSIRILAAALILLIAVVTPTLAALLGDATVSFRAIRTVTINGRSYSGAVVQEPGHQRHEQRLFGMEEVFLLDTNAATGIVILPSVKTYVEFPFPPLMAELGSPDLLQHPVGPARISGILTTKYRVDHTAHDGSRATGFLWVTRSRILMKFDLAVTRPHGGRPITIAMELSQLEIGPVDPGLFRLPTGMQRLPADALAPLLGGQPG